MPGFSRRISQPCFTLGTTLIFTENHPCLLLKKFLMAGSTGPNLNFIESVILETFLASIRREINKDHNSILFFSLSSSFFLLLLINLDQKSIVSYLSATRRCLDIHDGSCEMIDGLENLTHKSSQDKGHLEMTITNISMCKLCRTLYMYNIFRASNYTTYGQVIRWQQSLPCAWWLGPLTGWQPSCTGSRSAPEPPLRVFFSRNIHYTPLLSFYSSQFGCWCTTDWCASGRRTYGARPTCSPLWNV